ncbi:MAG: hypothetical protein WCJ30_15795 [Deltaproteobacteria bacterium]
MLRVLGEERAGSGDTRKPGEGETRIRVDAVTSTPAAEATGSEPRGGAYAVDAADVADVADSDGRRRDVQAR